MSDSPHPSTKPPAGPHGSTRREEYEFSERHKEALAALAASTSFVGICTMLLGLMSGAFAAVAGYGGFAALAGGLVAGCAVCLPLGWWTTAAGRSLSALVRTRGRDVAHLMDAVAHLRRLFGFTRVFIITYAVAAGAGGAALVWCNFAVERGGRCFAAWW